MTYIDFINHLKTNNVIQVEFIELINPFDTERVESKFSELLNTKNLKNKIIGFIDPRDLKNLNSIDVSYVLNENNLEELEEYTKEKFENENYKVKLINSNQYTLNGKTKPLIKLIQQKYTFEHNYSNLSSLMNYIRKIIDLKVVPYETSQKEIENLSPDEPGKRFVMVYQNTDNPHQCNIKFFATDNIVLRGLIGGINRTCFNYMRPVQKYQNVENIGKLVMAEETYQVL